MSKILRSIALMTITGLIAVLAPGPAEAQQGDRFQVIVNSSNRVGSMSASDVSRLFLKRRTGWDDGTKVQPVDLPTASSTREAFSQRIHNKSTKAIYNYWQNMVFSGRASAPTEKRTDAEVIAFVRANSGAIGYISAGEDTSGVKVLELR